jgi:DNA-binding NarL/FixJ family response regulator
MSTDHRIRLLVIHNDPLVQAGLTVALHQYPDLEVQNGWDPLAGQPSPVRPQPHLRVDVVVADYANGVALAMGDVHAENPTVPKVVVVAGIDREWEIRSAMERGVRGYLLVGCGLDELAAGVRAVHRGARYLSPQVAARLAESTLIEALTARESEVLRLVVEGLCNKAIGRRLGIAVGTVKSHLKSAFDKLNVESRTQAVAAVERRGLLQRPVPQMHAGNSMHA